MSDFAQERIYKTAQELIHFVYALEKLFPRDEADVLYHPARDLALEIGARVAASLACGGDGVMRQPHDAGRMDLLGKLASLRHYILTSHERFLIDERQVAEFEVLYKRFRVQIDPAIESGEGS